MYNRVRLASTCRASDNSWSHTAASWRAANNSSSNRITYVTGLNEEAIRAAYICVTDHDGILDTSIIGIGVDSTTAFSGAPSFLDTSVTGTWTLNAAYNGLTGIGSHYVSAIEYASAAGSTFYGDNGSPTTYQMALSIEYMY